MSPTPLDQPVKGQLCAKAGLERPLVATPPPPAWFGPEAGPRQGAGGFWAKASTSQLGLTRPHICFLVDKSCQLRQNDPCLLGLGEVGIT